MGWTVLAALLYTVAQLAGCEAALRGAINPQTGLVHFSAADRAIEIADAGTPPSGVPIAAVASVASGGRLPRLDALTWEPVRLPDHRARSTIQEAGMKPPTAVAWYRMRYPMPALDGADAAQQLAVYIPRAIGAPAQIYLDGSLLLDNRLRLRDQWNRPLFVPVPPSQRQAAAGSTLDLLVALPHDARLRDHALSTVWMGPADELRSMHDLRQFLQLTGPQVSALTIVVLGLFALVFWWRRRQELAYLLFGAAALAWWLRNLRYHMDAPSGWWTHAWFSWATQASFSWILVLTYLFSLRLHDGSHPGVSRALVAFTLLVSVFTMPFWPWEQSSLVLLHHVMNAVVCAGMLLVITLDAWRRRLPELIALAAILWVVVAMGVHDILLVSLVITPEAVYLMPYMALLLFGAFLYAAQRRYLQAITDVEQANSTLEVRLGERQAMLDASWQKLRDAEREQAVLRERQRLMRDMHDGVGSALMSSLVLVEQGQLDTRAVAELLRECMDDIKLVIDSMEPVDHDLVALLASLRYRLGRRMELAGVRLDWHVRDVPPLAWMDAGSALQILRIVQEALTNVLKHAQAQCVVLATELHDDARGQWVRVTITDDGCGFDTGVMDAPGRGPGRGLRNLRSRARALHGRLEMLSQPGCTELTLDLPVQTPPT